MKRPWQLLAVAFSLIVSTVALRGPWLDHAIWTLDEGSTFTMAQQVLDGDVVYRDAADNRSPLVPYLKAIVFAFAGDWNASAVYWVITLALGGCAVLVAWITRRFTDGVTAIMAGAAFVILQFYFVDSFDMMSANTEWFVVIFSVIGFAFFVTSIETHRLSRGLVAGLCFGAATLCKQPGILDFVAVTVMVLILGIPATASRLKLAKLWAAIASGVALPLIAAGIYFALNDAYADYIYYAFTFNTQVYVPEVPLAERLMAICKPLLMAWARVPVFAVLGVMGFGLALWSGLRGLFSRPVKVDVFSWLTLGWTVSGLISTTLSGREFAHYSVQLIPGFALLVTRVVVALRTCSIPRLRRFTPSLIGALAISSLIQCAYQHRSIARDLNGEIENEPPAIATIISQHSSNSERVFVWGYYPELYFYSQRLPATRFIYTNFITGMIAWSNIDSLQDTSNGVVPGGWEKFYQDFAETPPSLIVDTGYLRRQVKFLISDREPLWSEIQTHYAEVSLSDDPNQVRFFRRLSEDVHSSPSASPTAIDDRLQISGFSHPYETEPPRIEVRGPAGYDRLELLRDDTVIASLPYAATESIAARFFVPSASLSSGLYSIRAQGTTGAIQSAPFDFSTFAREQLATATREPAFEVGGYRFPPQIMSTRLAAIIPHVAIPDTWEFHAPARLLYNCPSGVTRITFSHGLTLPVIHLSDGYDLRLTWIAPDGSRTPIWEKRIIPRKGEINQRTQEEEIHLPSHHGGQLEFRFYSGEKSDTHNDNVFFGLLRGRAPGPVLALGENLTLSTPNSLTDAGDMSRDPEGRWLVHAPTRVSWSRPPNLMSLSFDYGIDPRAYEPNTNGHSNGVLFKLELVPVSGPTQVLFERLLEPFSQPEHRGAQSVRVELPQDIAGELVFSTGPGEYGDTSFDWAWIGSIVAESPGPPLVISPDRRIIPTLAEGFNDGWAYFLEKDRWSAHSPQFLTYPKSADLVEITLSYGLNPDAVIGEDGQQRSDGVEAVVVFIDANGTSHELYRHLLNPLTNTGDLGLQTATIPLPLGESGNVVLRMEAGPRNNNSYDWAYWGPLSGRIHND